MIEIPQHLRKKMALLWDFTLEEAECGACRGKIVKGDLELDGRLDRINFIFSIKCKLCGEVYDADATIEEGFMKRLCDKGVITEGEIKAIMAGVKESGGKFKEMFGTQEIKTEPLIISKDDNEPPLASSLAG